MCNCSVDAQAARDGREADVRAWLNSVPDSRKRKLLNAKDKHGFTAVHYAARFNRFKIMQLLLLDEAGGRSELKHN